MIHSDRFLDTLIERAKTWGLFFMLALVPISYTVGDDIRAYQEKLFVLCIVSYASLYFGNVWMTLFFLLNMGLFAWNGGQVGSSQIFNVFLGCLLFALARAYFTKHKSINLLRNAMLTVLIINLFYMLFQLNSIDPIFIGTNDRGDSLWGHSFNSASGLFNYKAATGMFLVLCIPFLMAFSVVVPLLLIIPIFLQSSAISYLAYAVSIMYGFFYIRMITFKKKITYYILFSLIAIVGIGGIAYDFKDDKLTGGSRFEVWHLVLKQSFRQPLFGWGPDSFRNLTKHKDFQFYSDEKYNPIYMDYKKPDEPIARYYSADEGKRIERFRGKTPAQFNMWGEAHNDYLQLLFEYGIVGVLLLGFFLHELYLRFRFSMEIKEVRILFGALLCFTIFPLIQFPFHLARIALFFPIFLGAFFAYTDKDWDTFVKGEQYG